jgi:5-methylcytosine-specific restriction enzyme subunit McrC
MSGISIYEFDVLVAETPDAIFMAGLHAVPTNVFKWLESQCLMVSDKGDAPWLRLTQRSSRRAVQVTSFVGVIRSPDGYQIEVLPKVGKAIGGGVVEARALLIAMLCCLQGFRHIQTDRAQLMARHMPLLEIFILEFLHAVDLVVKQGLRSEYSVRQDNLFALRGKLLIASHLRHNIVRADRFFTEHDEFSIDRPENRLLHAALQRVIFLSASQANLRLARELSFVFADVPVSEQTRSDFQRVRLDRGMGHYVDALAWARLILDEETPLTGAGRHTAPSLLFPMEALFEAFVAKHLISQVARPLTLKVQARSHHLVRHRDQNWFQLKPDMLIRDANRDILVLDTKWKLLDGLKANGSEKYGLSQSDFYQLQAYGQSYLDGKGDVILIYPRTLSFNEPLPVFEFPKIDGLRLWVLPFCLASRRLLMSDRAPFVASFDAGAAAIRVHGSAA